MGQIKKYRLKDWTEEGPCEFCGYPLYYPEDSPVFKIENLEHLNFCSRGCAIEYLHAAEYEIEA